jgi:four helix bundle protein
MATVKHFEELRVWQKARLLCKNIFEIISTGPFSKDYKLKEQINGSSGSVMDNIAEGFGREGKAEFIQYLSIAHGSVCETKSQLYRALDRKYISEETFKNLESLIKEISGMIHNFITFLRASNIQGNKYRIKSNV